MDKQLQITYLSKSCEYNQSHWRQIALQSHQNGEYIIIYFLFLLVAVWGVAAAMIACAASHTSPHTFCWFDTEQILLRKIA